MKSEKNKVQINLHNPTRGNENKCYYCGQAEKCTKDHFYPKKDGGVLTVFACALCQNSKRAMKPLEWLSYVNSHVAIADSAKFRIKNSVKSLEAFMKKKKLK